METTSGKIRRMTPEQMIWHESQPLVSNQMIEHIQHTTSYPDMILTA